MGRVGLYARPNPMEHPMHMLHRRLMFRRTPTDYQNIDVSRGVTTSSTKRICSITVWQKIRLLGTWRSRDKSMRPTPAYPHTCTLETRGSPVTSIHTTLRGDGASVGPIVVKAFGRLPSECSKLRFASDYMILAQSEQFVMVRPFDCGPSLCDYYYLFILVGGKGGNASCTSLCDFHPVSGGASVP